MESKNKTQQVLEFIAEAAGGRSFTQIQAFLWNLTYPGIPFTREKRGWWCTRLLGGMHYAHRPILHTYCTKVGGLWVRNQVAYIPGARG